MLVLLLNCGGRYPSHLFIPVTSSRNLRSFPDACSWDGKTLKVLGTVQLYREKPEIIQTASAQVTEAKRTSAAGRLHGDGTRTLVLARA